MATSRKKLVIDLLKVSQNPDEGNFDRVFSLVILQA